MGVGLHDSGIENQQGFVRRHPGPDQRQRRCDSVVEPAPTRPLFEAARRGQTHLRDRAEKPIEGEASGPFLVPTRHVLNESHPMRYWHPTEHLVQEGMQRVVVAAELAAKTLDLLIQMVRKPARSDVGRRTLLNSRHEDLPRLDPGTCIGLEQ